jgi:hypothetical protein
MTGPEDYPAPTHVPTVRELNAIYRGPRWAAFDMFVHRMLKVGGMLLVWAVIALLITAAIKGDV